MATTQTNSIPSELKAIPQWVNWRPVTRNGKTTKPPINPHTGKLAKVNDPATWGDFSLCSSKSPNSGYVLTVEDGHVCIDFDDCIDADGNINPVVWQFVLSLNSYTELSPSRRGLHVWGRAKIDRNHGSKPYEIYQQEHYLTVTGDHVPGTPTTINDIQNALSAFVDWISQQKGEGRTQEGGVTSLTLSDRDIIQRALTGDDLTFAELFNGTHPHATNDPSRADYWLALRIAFYSDDPNQINRIMRASNLNRDKYDRPLGQSTYLDYTVHKVLSSKPNKYSGQRVTVATKTLDQAPDKSPGDLVGELFPGASMVAPGKAHFTTGKYASKWLYPHTCDNYLHAEPDDNGNTIQKRYTSRLWRKRVKGDLVMEACPGCQRDYGMLICKQIETECGAYSDKHPFRWQIMPELRTGAFVNAARKKHGTDFRYWRIPLQEGRMAIIHNATHSSLKRYIKGKAHNLPIDKSKLEKLIMRWVKDVRQGTKRAAHSRGWGGVFKGVKGDGRPDGEKPITPKVKITADYKSAYAALQNHLGVDIVPKQTGIHITEFISILDRAKVRFHVEDKHGFLDAMRGKMRDDLSQSYKVHSTLAPPLCSTMYPIESEPPEQPESPPDDYYHEGVEPYAYGEMVHQAREKRAMAAL